VRLVLWITKASTASRWAAVCSIAAKIGCTAQALHEWVKKAERDSGARAGVPTDVATKLKALEGENRELRQANAILRKASAFFAQRSSTADSGCLHVVPEADGSLTLFFNYLGAHHPKMTAEEVSAEIDHRLVLVL
jgi:transposase